MKKILVIEDEPAYLQLLQDQLVKNGYQVAVAKDGNTGLNLAIIQKPDLILLDLRMPMMDGITVLDKLRKDNYGKKAEVIILTNIEPSGWILKRVLEDQPDCYLIKSDISLSQLIAKIKDILSAK